MRSGVRRQDKIAVANSRHLSGEHVRRSREDAWAVTRTRSCPRNAWRIRQRVAARSPQAPLRLVVKTRTRNAEGKSAQRTSSRYCVALPAGEWRVRLAWWRADSWLDVRPAQAVDLTPLAGSLIRRRPAQVTEPGADHGVRTGAASAARTRSPRGACSVRYVAVARVFQLHLHRPLGWLDSYPAESGRPGRCGSRSVRASAGWRSDSRSTSATVSPPVTRPGRRSGPWPASSWTSCGGSTSVTTTRSTYTGTGEAIA